MRRITKGDRSFFSLGKGVTSTCMVWVCSLALAQSTEASFSGRAKEPSANQLGGMAEVCAIVLVVSEVGWWLVRMVSDGD